MIFVRKIDENGMFIEDAFVEELTEFTIESPCSAGFYHPRWDGEKWVEGLTQEEIDVIKSSAILQEPAIEERVETIETKTASLEETLDVLFGGV